MTKAEWMQSTDLSAMLEALGGEVSDSKLRLFSCACCRLAWNVFDNDLHRRTVEYAEWFARGPGQGLMWLGAGNWTRRRLTCPTEQIERTAGWAAIMQELEAEQDAMDENAAAFYYDNCTPHGTALCTLHLAYQFPYAVSHGVAVLQTAPFAYWQHALAPELSNEQEQQWKARIDAALASHCDLLRQVYGDPDLA